MVQETPALREGRHQTALAFANLNLTQNPFGELSLEERQELVALDLAHLAEFLCAPRCVVQVIGDSGRGKTTHLLAIRRHLPHAPYVLVPENRAIHIPHAPAVLVDEAQNLPGWRRLFLFRRGDAMALATHVDYTRDLERWGYRVVTVRPEEEQSLERLRDAFNRRIAAFQRGPGFVPTVPLETVAILKGRFGTNVRAMEWCLYDAMQGMTSVGDVVV